MTDVAATPATLTTQRSNPFDPPAEYMRLAATGPIHPLAYPDGTTGWLVTGYGAVRTVLGDTTTFSSRLELLKHPVHAQYNSPEPSPPGGFPLMDPPEHTRLRKSVTGAFTVRRMRQLTTRIEQIVSDHLDLMEQAGPPVELVEAFALPIPSLVICEILGVPYDDREQFQRDAVSVTMATDMEEAMTALGATIEYIAGLVAAKQANPTDDLLSDLIRSGELDDDELAGVGTMLLAAGFDTTTNMLALGTFALLQHPEQMAALRDNPDLMPGAVEELMRYLTITHQGEPRFALADTEIAGTQIKSGDHLIVLLEVANRDPERFAHGDRLDVTANANGHIGFGHGPHQCLGQQLARIEMQIAYRELLRRFPTLELAVSADEVPLRSESFIYGVHSLPVTWKGYAR